MQRIKNPLLNKHGLQIRANQGNKATGRQTILVRIHSTHLINKIIVQTYSPDSRSFADKQLRVANECAS
jgi:hypothetical protein